MAITLPTVRRREALVIIAIAALYLVLWIMLPKPSFWGLDNGIKFQGMTSFARTGHIGVHYSGTELGVDSRYRSIMEPFGVYGNGYQIPVFSPLFLIFGGALLRLFGPVGPFLIPLLGGWACLIASWLLWIRQREPHDGRGYLVMVGLGSPILFYSLTIWEHAISAALVTLSFAFLPPIRRQDRNSPPHQGTLLAGVFLGLAAALRVEIGAIALLVLIFWKMTSRSSTSAMRYVVGILIVAVLDAAINYWQAGEVLPLQLRTNLTAYFPNSTGTLIITRLQNFYKIFIEGFEENLWSVAGVLPLIVIMAWRGWRREEGWWPYVAAILLVVEGVYLTKSMLAPNRVAHTQVSGGILWVMPFSVLAFLPMRGERRKFWSLIWAVWILFFLFIAAISPTMSGIHWGPRICISVTPLLLLVAVTRAQRWWEKHPTTRPIIVLLAIGSIVNEGYAFDLMMTQRHYDADLNRWAASTGSEPIITALWWIPGDCSLASYEKPWFVVKKGTGLREVIDSLRHHDVKRCNYLELPPYINDEFWWSVGVKRLGSDYFLEGDGTLRRTWLQIISPTGELEEAAAPADSLR